MQPLIFEGSSTSSPNNIDGVLEANSTEALEYAGSEPEVVEGPIGRYAIPNDDFG